MQYGSPYTPGAGAMPRYLAGRDELLLTADKYLQAMIKGYPQQPVIYYGLRGVGKTVLLNKIEESAEEQGILYSHIEIAEKRSFIRQIASSSRKIAHQMSVIESAKDFGRKALGIIQAFNVTYNPEDQTFSAGLTDSSAYVTSGILADDLTEMFVSMGRTATKAGKVICFFVDEIQYMKDSEMEALINALHRVNQLRLPIMLFGAGLPKVLRIFGEVKSYSERLFKYVEIAELSDEAATAAIVKPAEDWNVVFDEAAVAEIKRWSKGYPYFIQELCNTIWEFTDKDRIEKADVERVIPTFLNHLDEGFFRVRYDRCTKKVSSVSPIRAKLISKGIIYSTGHGEIDFTVPQFDAYLQRINPELKLDGE